MTEQASVAAKLLFYSAIGLLLLLPAAPLGVQAELWTYRAGLAMLGLSMAGSFIVQLLHALMRLRHPSGQNRRYLRRASLVALLPLLFAAALLHEGGDKPLIHDISTDTESPPDFVAALTLRGDRSNPLAYDADSAHQQRQAYPNLATLNSALTTDQSFALALAVANEMGWHVHHKQPDSGQIEAIATSFWFKFKDDIVIRIRPEQHGSRIDLRSSSRVGRGDLGANARRIQEFQRRFRVMDATTGIE